MICNINFEVSDWIAIFGVIITLILGTYVVNNQTKNRSQKDFFINEISSLKNDYTDFIKNILSDNLNSQFIRDQFKIFSDRIRILQEILRNEYSVKTEEIFSKHGQLQVKVTALQSIEEQYSRDKVLFSGEEKTRISELFNPLHKEFLKLVISVNKASSAKPWEKEDFYNY